MDNIIKDCLIISSERLEQITSEWFVRHFSHATKEEDKNTAGYARAYLALEDLKAQLNSGIVPFQPVPSPSEINTLVIDDAPVVEENKPAVPAAPAVEPIAIVAENDNISEHSPESTEEAPVAN